MYPSRPHTMFWAVALGKEAVNTLISEAMCLPPSLSQPLSTIIHSKTAGSPLFCVNFLTDGLIRFNLTTRRWDYDIKSILTKEIPLSVVQYMKSQMVKLPLSFRLVLKLASCLGNHFDYATFLKAKVKSDYDLDTVLPLVCQLGLLYKLAPGKFMWAHDQVRQVRSFVSYFFYRVRLNLHNKDTSFYGNIRLHMSSFPKISESHFTF